MHWFLASYNVPYLDFIRNSKYSLSVVLEVVHWKIFNSEDSQLLTRMASLILIHVLFNICRALFSIIDAVPTFYVMVFTNLYAIVAGTFICVFYGGVCEFLVRTQSTVLQPKEVRGLEKFFPMRKMVSWFGSPKTRSAYLIVVWSLVLVSHVLIGIFWRETPDIYFGAFLVRIFVLICAFKLPLFLVGIAATHELRAACGTFLKESRVVKTKDKQMCEKLTRLLFLTEKMHTTTKINGFFILYNIFGYYWVLRVWEVRIVPVITQDYLSQLSLLSSQIKLLVFYFVNQKGQTKLKGLIPELDNVGEETKMFWDIKPSPDGKVEGLATNARTDSTVEIEPTSPMGSLVRTKSPPSNSVANSVAKKDELALEIDISDFQKQ